MEKAKLNTTSLNSEVNCELCKDTSWILTKDGAYTRCNCFYKEQLKRMWLNFGVNPDKIKKLNAYETYDDVTTKAKEMARKYINDYKDESLALLGKPGAGKTHIILAIGAALLNKNIRVVYMPYLEVMMELKANSMDEENYIKIIEKYLNANLLIIDDLFKDKVKNGKLLPSGLTEADLKHIYRILNVRYNNHSPIIVSSECTPKMLMNLDEAIARRILEPCGKNIIVFGEKHNYSMRKFEK
jgi:DNA replication protein DnaC